MYISPEKYAQVSPDVLRQNLLIAAKLKGFKGDSPESAFEWFAKKGILIANDPDGEIFTRKTSHNYKFVILGRSNESDLLDYSEWGFFRWTRDLESGLKPFLSWNRFELTHGVVWETCPAPAFAQETPETVENEAGQPAPAVAQEKPVKISDAQKNAFETLDSHGKIWAGRGMGCVAKSTLNVMLKNGWIERCDTPDESYVYSDKGLDFWMSINDNTYGNFNPQFSPKETVKIVGGWFAGKTAKVLVCREGESYLFFDGAGHWIGNADIESETPETVENEAGQPAQVETSEIEISFSQKTVTNAENSPCIICGKEVKSPKNFVRVFWGHLIVTDARANELIANGNAGADLGLQPIGAGCLQKHPQLKHFADDAQSVIDSANDETPALNAPLYRVGQILPVEIGINLEYLPCIEIGVCGVNNSEWSYVCQDWGGRLYERPESVIEKFPPASQLQIDFILKRSMQMAKNLEAILKEYGVNYHFILFPDNPFQKGVKMASPADFALLVECSELIEGYFMNSNDPESLIIWFDNVR